MQNSHQMSGGMQHGGHGHNGGGGGGGMFQQPMGNMQMNHQVPTGLDWTGCGKRL